MLSCEASRMTTSAGRSSPVFAGTLYRITGKGLASATYTYTGIQHALYTHRIFTTLWLGGRALDLRFTGRGFSSRPVAFT